MSLDFDEDVLGAEGADQLVENFSGGTAGWEARRTRPAHAGGSPRYSADQWSFVVACQRDQAFGGFREFTPAHGGFAFFVSQMSARQQAAKILITHARLDE